jgi:hypothetical protein
MDYMVVGLMTIVLLGYNKPVENAAKRFKSKLNLSFEAFRDPVSCYWS